MKLTEINLKPYGYYLPEKTGFSINRYHLPCLWIMFIATGKYYFALAMLERSTGNRRTKKCLTF